MDSESGTIIGSSRYNGLDLAANEIEIGWTFLARGYWGGSYNREIKRLMLEHAFEYVETVVFWVGGQNGRSQQAMIKIGGQLRPGDWTRQVGAALEPYVVFEINKEKFSL